MPSQLLLSRGGSMRARLAQVLPASFSLALRAYLHRLLREPEIGMLQSFCDPVLTSLDIGANRGQYAYFMRRYSGELICFEPHPRLADYLREGLGDGVRVRQCALSDQAGRAILFVPLAESRRENDGLATLNPAPYEEQPLRRINVPVQRLDDLRLGRVGFIKIDVEGLEINVLRGARHLIARDRPRLLIESERRHSPAAPEELFSLLADVGYSSHFWFDGRWRPSSAFDFGLHQNPEHAPAPSGVTRGPYVNNFLFLPRERRRPDLPGL